jgi:hypothetical protein
MPTTTFTIDLPRHKAILFYTAEKNRVVVTDRAGRRLSLPWRLLQPYMTHDGVQGEFVIDFDENGKCLSLSPLE